MTDERMYSQPAGIIEKMQASVALLSACIPPLTRTEQALDSRRVRSGGQQRVVYSSLAASTASASEDDADTLSGAAPTLATKPNSSIKLHAAQVPVLPVATLRRMLC
jgi:hypothetical protein